MSWLCLWVRIDRADVACITTLLSYSDPQLGFYNLDPTSAVTTLNDLHIVSHSPLPWSLYRALSPRLHTLNHSRVSNPGAYMCSLAFVFALVLG